VFAHVAIDKGHPEVGAAAVICFEWLQRPENVLAGFISRTDYRGSAAPTAIRITHHKTGAVVLHPLEDSDGTQFYADAEVVLLQCRGLSARATAMLAAGRSRCRRAARRPPRPDLVPLAYASGIDDLFIGRA
jgi:hypothetical protein